MKENYIRFDEAINKTLIRENVQKTKNLFILDWEQMIHQEFLIPL